MANLASRLTAFWSCAALVATSLLAPISAQAQDAGNAQPDAITALYQPQDEDERGLWLQMNELERETRASPLVIRDPDLNEYVRGVLCKTVGEAKCANTRIYIIRTPQFNATMAPNGMMEIWSGLLLRMENEAQLAAVLGHEYAHFEKRHSVRLFRNAKSKTNTASFLSIIPIAGGLIGLGLLSTVFSFSREMEREADAGSVEFLAQAGYDTREIARIWERLGDEMDNTAKARGTKSRRNKSGGMFGTHPPNLERIETLRAAAEANPGVAGATGEAEFRAVMQYHWPEFVDDQLKLNDFGGSEFLLAGLADKGWTPYLLYARGELYRRQNTPDMLAKAEGFFSEAIEQGSEISQLWRGRGLARLKLGQREAGQADLKEYLRRAPQASDAAMMAMMAGV